MGISVCVLVCAVCVCAMSGNEVIWQHTHAKTRTHTHDDIRRKQNYVIGQCIYECGPRSLSLSLSHSTLSLFISPSLSLSISVSCWPPNWLPLGAKIARNSKFIAVAQCVQRAEKGRWRKGQRGTEGGSETITGPSANDIALRSSRLRR